MRTNKRTYPEQSQLMANVLDLIKNDDLEDVVLEVGGEELLPILRRCQSAYEAMVDQRATKDAGSRTNLRTARARLQRRIVTYNNLLMTMLVEDDPQTLVLVESALEPMITMHTQLGSVTITAALAEVEAELEAEAEGEGEAEAEN